MNVMPFPIDKTAFDTALKEATDAHQSGRFADAAERYRALLSVAPDDANLQYLLGAACTDLGSYEEAVEHLEHALELRPAHLPTIEMLGSAWFRSGNPNAAAAYFRKAESLAPGRPEALARLANALRLARKTDEARHVYKTLLTQAPSHRQAQVGLAVCLAELGDVASAEAILCACVRQHPDYANGYTTLATMLAQAGRFADAEKVVRELLAKAPSHLEARRLLAGLLHKQGRLEEAEGEYRAVLEETPNDVQISLQLGESLLDQMCPDAAEAILAPLRLAVPDHAGVLTALGRVYEQRGELEKAVELHSMAIANSPRSENAYTNRGSAKRLAGNFDGALADYEAALAINPAFSPAVANRGLTLLTLGRFGEAWPQYRSRIKAKAGVPDLTAGKPWDGASLRGKRVLAWLEYGLGDEILFAGLLPEFLKEVASCTIVCSPRLRALFTRSFPAAKVIAMGEAIGDDFDVHLPLTDAAQALRCDLASFPSHNGYLSADQTLVQELRQRYSPTGSERIVGVSWRSASGSTGRFKSSNLADWEKVLRTPGITFVSLQYGDAQEDIARATAAGCYIIQDRSIDADGDLDAFAAQVAAMDLVISVSNTTVHVAGALGRPVWTLVPTGPGAHWYWFLNRTDSPWYPSARLFRQSKRGDWRDPLTQVGEALGAWSRR